MAVKRQLALNALVEAEIKKLLQDEYVLPLCVIHHNALHSAGDEKQGWKKRFIDLLVVAADFLGREIGQIDYLTRGAFKWCAQRRSHGYGGRLLCSQAYGDLCAAP